MRESGPFGGMGGPSDDRDRQARMILIGMGIVGVILLILVLPPISLLSGGGDSPTQTRSGVPRAPEGLEALSRLHTLEQPRGTEGPYLLTVNLVEPTTDGRNLALYTSRGGRWERIATATLVNSGAAVQAEVQDFPSNVAVFRGLSASAMVSGWLPQGLPIDPEIVDRLAVLNPVDFAPGPDGGLVGSPSPHRGSENTRIIPTVRADNAQEMEAVNAILSSPQLREAHINALIQLAMQQDYGGVDVDYRNVQPARKPDFTAFVTTLAERLHQANKQLSITLPAPVRTGVAWETGAYDWEALARVVDVIKLVPEQDPGQYYARTEEVLSFLRPKVDLRKIVLVIGRDSKERGGDGIRALPLMEGLGLASVIEVRTQNILPNAQVVIVGRHIYQADGATGLRWDDVARAVSFSYPAAGGQRTVYLENALSVAFRIDLARRYGLGGIQIDNVGIQQSGANIWAPVRTYAETGAVRLVAPNGALLRPVWQSQSGSIEAGQRGDVTWQAPAQPGSYDVFLVISDGVIRVSQKVVIEVRAQTQSQASPQPTATRTP